MKTTMQKALSYVAASWLAMTAQSSINAQTYTWDQQAMGQEFQHCPDLNAQYWPNDTQWTQSLAYGPNCDNSTNVVYQPSNWTPTPPPGVYPGGPGLEGVDVVLGAYANPDIESASVIVNHLTLQTNGSLYLGYFGALTATTIDIQGDTTIGAGSYAGELNVASGGSLTKSGGTGTLGFGNDGYGNAVSLNAINANLVVASGTLALPYKGGGGWYGGTFAISNNAALILNVDNGADPSLCDTITGVGAGTVLMTATVRTYGYDFNGNPHNGLTLNFPGKMFQWAGGVFLAGGSVTNLGFLNLTNAPGLGASMFNNGTLNLADNSSFALGGSFLYNQAGGIFNLMGSSSVTGTLLNNYGLLVKSAGVGLAQISAQLKNYGGIIEADSGTLALNLGGSGSYYTNTWLVVSNGAIVTLLTSNFSEQVEGTLTGSGGGSVLMNNGTLASEYNATLNFPGPMFQWAGGFLQGPLQNAGTLNLVGPAGLFNSFANDSLVVQSGAGALAGSATFNNDAAGVYDIQNDNAISTGTFSNAGLLEKTAGSGTNVIAGTINNSGTIHAASGAILFNETFNQNAGTLQVTPAIQFGPNRPFYLNGGTVTGLGTLGGTAINNAVYANGGVVAPGNPYGALSVPGGSGFAMAADATFHAVLGGPGQFSQLVVSNTANLGGTLNVTLTNGYVPAIGTQFHIIACPNTVGSFTALNVPVGMSVTYSNVGGVYLTMIGATPVKLVPLPVSGAQVAFGFGTGNGMGYTVQQNNDLKTTNWTYYTNFIGDGSLYQFLPPITNSPRLYFRVRQP